MKIWQKETAVIAICFSAMSALVSAQTPDDMLELSDKQAALRDAQAAVLKAQSDYDVVRKRVVDANVAVVKTVQAAISAEDVAALKAQIETLTANKDKCKAVAVLAAEKWATATTILGVRAAAGPLFACLAE